jgi:hypothetical protein
MWLGFERKSKPNEYVVFFWHYDHWVWVLQKESKHDTTDSIYNGAMMMLGTTAVILWTILRK